MAKRHFLEEKTDAASFALHCFPASVLRGLRLRATAGFKNGAAGETRIEPGGGRLLGYRSFLRGSSGKNLAASPGIIAAGGESAPLDRRSWRARDRLAGDGQGSGMGGCGVPRGRRGRAHGEVHPAG